MKIPSPEFEETKKLENISPEEEGPVDNFQCILNDSLHHDQSEMEPVAEKQGAKTTVIQTHKRSTQKGSSL